MELAVPDGALGKVFGLKRNAGSFTITSFDIHTAAPLDFVTVSGDGIPADLIRWGTNGLAVALTGADGTGGTVYLLSGSFVDSPVGPSVQPYIFSVRNRGRGQREQRGFIRRVGVDLRRQPRRRACAMGWELPDDARRHQRHN